METINLICMVGLFIGAYYWGKSDGVADANLLDEDAQYELEIYKIDKYYEHKRWEYERKASHE